MKAYIKTGLEMLQKHFSPLDFNFFLNQMPIILDLARGMSDMEGREFDRRGYLTVMDGTNGEIIFTVPFGEIPKDKQEKYFELSQEKAHRLFSQVCMNLPDGHTSSFQSRNVDEDKYGGSIYLNLHSTVLILSFSGMPELIDEAMMIVLAEKVRIEIGKSPRKKIEACYRNQYWELLLKKLNQHELTH